MIFIKLGVMKNLKMVLGLFTNILFIKSQLFKIKGVILLDNDLKKIIIAVLVSGIIGVSSVIFTLIKDVNTLKSEYETSVSALNKMEIAVESLKKNRESLSDYYVTRREFNSTIEQQNALLSGLDRKLEKLTDVFVMQYNKNKTKYN